MLTIAICTHNRATDVRICLEHLHPQIDFHVAELLLVDSASSPAEARALDRSAAAFLGLRLIHLGEPGISRARNVAVEAAHGAWIAFLDDDAVPAEDWFANVVRLVDHAPDNCALLGGDIAPVFPDGVTPHIGRRWRQYLSLIEQPDESFTARHVSVCGVNSAYRCSFLEECGGFPESLGRVGTKLLSGEEKLVQEVALVHGWTAARSNRLRVGHRISAERLRRRWATRRAYWDGVSDERIGFIIGVRTTALGAMELTARLLVLGALYPFFPTRREFFLRFWYTLGRLRQWFGRRPARSALPDRTSGGRYGRIGGAVPLRRGGGGSRRASRSQASFATAPSLPARIRYGLT